MTIKTHSGNLPVGQQRYEIAVGSIFVSLTTKEIIQLYRTVTAVREAINAKERTKYHKNPQNHLKRCSRWRQNNPERLKGYAAKYIEKRKAEKQTLEDAGLKLLIHKVNKKHKEQIDAERNPNRYTSPSLC